MKQETVEMFREIFKILAPPPDMTISEWADTYRRLSLESSAEPGRWKTEKAPYQREIMDAISDIRVPKVVVMSAAQVGKTDGFILNPIGYFMQYDPSPIMVMQPTITMGEEFSKNRLDPMVRDTPALAEMMSTEDEDEVERRRKKRQKKVRSTILQKKFPGGHITIVGANSPSSLASRPIRILLADEIDRYPPTAGNEGDPLALAAKRLTTFWNRKTVCVSTPTVKGVSRIEVEYENSTRERWQVPCPVCGEYQPLRWSGVTFNREDLSHIGYTCEHCGTLSDEAEWKETAVHGKFVAENPSSHVRGFHLNAMASLFVSWREIVEEFLTANEEAKKGNPEMMKVWTNTVLGETWEEVGTQLEWETLFQRREDYGCDVPENVMILTAGVDTQDDRFEIEVVGWGKDMESWGIMYFILYGDMNQPDVWKRLDEFLLTTIQRADGAVLGISAVCIDSGGHYTNEVYKFTKAREGRNIFSIKGRGGDDVPYIQRATKNNREKAHLFTLGVDTGKSRLYNRLMVNTPGANYCHFPIEPGAGYSEEYFMGLTSERREIRYRKGRHTFVWTLRDGRRNEPLDCRNYATAAMEIFGVANLKQSSGKRKTAARRQLSEGI